MIILVPVDGKGNPIFTPEFVRATTDRSRATAFVKQIVKDSKRKGKTT